MQRCTSRYRCLAALFLLAASGLYTTTSAAQTNQLSEARGHIVVLRAEPMAAQSSAQPSPKSGSRARNDNADASPGNVLREEQQRVIEAIESTEIAHGLTPRADRVQRRWSLALNAIRVQGLTDEQMAILEAMPEVTGIYENRVVTALPQVEAITGLQFHETDFLIPRNLGLTGRGVSVGVLDSGINWNHPDFGGCFGTGCTVVGGIDVVNRDRHPMDDNGHGTSVASRIAGRGLSRGLARGAQIHAIKVLDQTGNGLISTVVDGLEYAMDPNGDCCNPATGFCIFTPSCTADRLDVVNLSVNVPGGSMDDPLASAVNRAVDIGIVAVAAAGNAGPGVSSIGSPGAALHAITVGAYEEESGTVASTSGRGPAISRFSDRAARKPDLVAPGVNVCAAVSRPVTPTTGGSCETSRRHTLVSGTSQAAPEVAAAAALILENKPDWTPDQIKKYLTETAVSLGVGSMRQGAGRLNLSNLFAPASTSDDASPQAIIRIQCQSLVCRFSATDSSSTGPVHRFTWATSNSRVRDGEAVSFRYPKAGNYSISLRVIDTAGRVGRSRLTFSVREQ